MSERLTYTNPTEILQIYQLLYDVDYVLTKNNIKYCIEGGTLLGAIRHHGMIPWDDDADIFIESIEEHKLLPLKPLLNTMGYNIIKSWFGYKIYLSKGQSIIVDKAKPNTKHPWNYPFLDIFIGHKDGYRFRYTYPLAERNYKHCFFTVEEMYPLTRYKFGNIELTGPNDATGYLIRTYGKDWNDVAYRQYDHKEEHPIDKIKISLTEFDRLPGEFMEPIVRHESIIESCATLAPTLSTEDTQHSI